jgi:folate-binding Fe-S cluster repair protein YgfZ
MSSVKIARLTDRGVVCVDGADSEKLLQSLVTNEIEGLNAGIFSTLLPPRPPIS